jgi:hypothetical protein
VSDALAEERLVFLVGSPRAGTTLLSRMLSAHSDVFAPAEPHLMPPLAHLGYWETVERAPYDPIITQRGLREFVATLPAGEADLVAGLRACTDHLYARSLSSSGAGYFLDQTPAYALVLDFVTRLYPGARYVVLTRNPLAIWSSYVDSFFDGDFESAYRNNPLVERYVPAIARFLRETDAAHVHVRYEDVVSQPETELRRICECLRLDFQPGMVDYGDQAGGQRQDARGLGDPVTVAKEKRPTTGSIDKWAKALQGAPARIAQSQQILARLADADLEAWGYTRDALAAGLAAIDPEGAPPPKPKLTRYALERRAMVAGRRWVQRSGFLQRTLRFVRSACDVMLR